MRVYTEMEFEYLKSGIEAYVLANTIVMPILEELGTPKKLDSWSEAATREYGWSALYEHYGLEDQKTPLSPEELSMVLEKKKAMEGK